MRAAIIAAASVVILTGAMAHAQTASSNAAAPTGDSAVSPAAKDPVNESSSSTNRPNLGAGIASGAVNNGTSGDTIGTGHGTSAAPAGSATTGPVTGTQKQ